MVIAMTHIAIHLVVSDPDKAAAAELFSGSATA
jgi:hypothetical protein